MPGSSKAKVATMLIGPPSPAPARLNTTLSMTMATILTTTANRTQYQYSDRIARVAKFT
jgi:hypothetical protein